ncbi:hypothetical protein N0V93_006121 [Gnomoniopsis smithogilvyi]|uniref:Uncharacterized protein n=1 Tax=Gnomoniopsis smithogilvyi TaxID=1191159 RepID=A0A9W8YMN8_9PEZI|nr:hypothetical protein N0V93_006121 [Gnomoniopsis smithogilvyi]
MVAYRILFLAGAAAALPLNINLGAYSPALVVGDGEISFGGAAAAAPATAAPAAAAPAAAAPAAAAAEQNQVTAGTTTAAADPALQDQAQQIAALQGMGKAVLPRDEEASNVNKRDLASFDRALKYAEAALVKGPKVQLGTGEGGAGVGIIVDNNPTAAARPGTGAAAEGAAAAAKKRDLPSSNKVKVTTMYVRSGIPSSLQNDNKMTARGVEEGVEPRYETIQIAPAKREANPNPGAIDAVNLNVSGEQGVTMTFVETIEDDEE